MSAFATVQINEQSFQQAEAFLTRVPLEMRTAVIPKALKAAALPVVKMAKQLAPDSVKSGSRQRWSKKLQAERAGKPQHKDTIVSSTVRSKGDLSKIHVWPLRGPGNLINILAHEHQQVAWGHHTGKTLPATQYLVNAAAQTSAEQQSAFVEKVKIETDKLLAQGAKP